MEKGTRLAAVILCLALFASGCTRGSGGSNFAKSGGRTTLALCGSGAGEGGEQHRLETLQKTLDEKGYRLDVRLHVYEMDDAAGLCGQFQRPGVMAAVTRWEYDVLHEAGLLEDIYAQAAAQLPALVNRGQAMEARKAADTRVESADAVPLAGRPREAMEGLGVLVRREYYDTHSVEVEGFGQWTALLDAVQREADGLGLPRAHHIARHFGDFMQLYLADQEAYVMGASYMLAMEAQGKTVEIETMEAWPAMLEEYVRLRDGYGLTLNYGENITDYSSFSTVLLDFYFFLWDDIPDCSAFYLVPITAFSEHGGAGRYLVASRGTNPGEALRFLADMQEDPALYAAVMLGEEGVDYTDHGNGTITMLHEQFRQGLGGRWSRLDFLYDGGLEANLRNGKWPVNYPQVMEDFVMPDWQGATFDTIYELLKQVESAEQSGPICMKRMDCFEQLRHALQTDSAQELREAYAAQTWPDIENYLN